MDNKFTVNPHVLIDMITELSECKWVFLQSLTYWINVYRFVSLSHPDKINLKMSSAVFEGENKDKVYVLVKFPSLI